MKDQEETGYNWDCEERVLADSGRLRLLNARTFDNTNSKEAQEMILLIAQKVDDEEKARSLDLDCVQRITSDKGQLEKKLHDKNGRIHASPCLQDIQRAVLPSMKALGIERSSVQVFPTLVTTHGTRFPR